MKRSRSGSSDGGGEKKRMKGSKDGGSHTPIKLTFKIKSSSNSSNLSTTSLVTSSSPILKSANNNKTTTTTTNKQLSTYPPPPSHHHTTTLATTSKMPPFSRFPLLASAEMEEDKNFKNLIIHSDHHERPLWVLPNRHFFLETFSPIYKQAYDFMIAIAEPVCRPQYLHEYKLTQASLCAAIWMNLTAEEIIETLTRLSKNEIPQDVKTFIIKDSSQYGKLRLVLQSNGYFVESEHREVLKILLQDRNIQECRQKISAHSLGGGGEGGLQTSAAPQQVTMSAAGTLQSGALQSQVASTNVLDEFDLDTKDLSASSSSSSSSDGKVHSFELIPAKVEEARKICWDKCYPMMQEYDFRNDAKNENVPIDLKPSTMIRNYQEKSLSKMFGNGRARSGVIVLPCGAGKSLVGITACCTVKKSALVLCDSGVSVEQWKQQFKKWTTIGDSKIARFTSQTKELDDNEKLPPVVITTYTMVAYRGQRTQQTEYFMKLLQEREWGILVLDEVHVVPAEMFRKVISVTKAHCKLGLTATLVREDQKIEDLHYLLGPKLYEANWLDLQRSGYLARVQCAEVWCPMSPKYYEEYYKSDKMQIKQLLWVMNPNKMRACEFLIQYHEARGDKIVVFADSINGLKTYATKFGKAYICGDTGQDERMRVIDKFKSGQINTFFISKVGDTAIDLPDANVIIQVSSHFGSRRQEAQRLGRILRPKSKVTTDEFNAFFYSLVSKDTQEMYFSTKRQKFLVDQGYSFKIITNLEDGGGFSSCLSAEDEKRILESALSQDGDADEKLNDDPDLVHLKKGKTKKSTGRNLSSISGGNHRVYREPAIPKMRSEIQKKRRKEIREAEKRQQQMRGDS